MTLLRVQYYVQKVAHMLRKQCLLIKHSVLKTVQFIID